MLQKLAFLLLIVVCGIHAAQPAREPSCPGGTFADADGVCKTHYAEEAVWPDEFWPSVGKVVYEGPTSSNPLSYRYYNADEVLLGKPMKEWLRFSIAFWHTLRGQGSDPFGAASRKWPWEQGTDNEMVLAFRRLHAVFELMEKLGLTFWAFHDRDIAPEGKTLKETNENLDAVVEVAMELQKGTEIRPLWATANLFSHPRYKDGAATSANATVFAHAAAQVKKAMDVAQQLQAQNFVFWGGREGYSSLLTTNLKLEIDNYARFLHMAANYSREIGFAGQLMLEPKPQEPTKHQYDWDVATTLHFLSAHNLSQRFKLNIECNHATLAGHSCEHELRYASIYDALGSIDANTGDPQVGWDTDQFLTDPREATLLMSAVIDNGGLAPGGINFDAKLRRESTDPVDVIFGLISGIDALARGLRNAVALKEAGLLDALKASRYSSWGEGCHTLGGAVQVGKVGFKELETHALHHQKDVGQDPPSQRIELAEIYLDMAIN